MSLRPLTGRRVRVDAVAPIHMDPARQDGILATADPATGFLHLEGRISRTGVQRYRDAEGNEWGELRRAEDVFHPDALASFRHVVVTNDHPADFVTVRNVRDVQAGQVGSDVRPDGVHVRAPIVVTDAATILAIRDGKTELSCGYSADMVEDAGELEGEAYQLRQTNIRGNHLAIVDRARGGPTCALIGRGDGSAIATANISAAPRADSTQRRDAAPPEPPMKNLKKLIVDALAAAKAKKPADAKKLATDAVAVAKKSDEASAEQIVALLTKAIESGEDMLVQAALALVGDMLGGGGMPEPPTEEPPADGANQPAAPPAAPPGFDAADAVKLRAKVDALEAERRRDRETETARIDARVALVSQARAIMPSLDPVGKTDDDIKRAVVLEVQPEQKAKLDANGAKVGYLDALYEAAIELHAARKNQLDNQGAVLFRATTDGSEEKLDAIYKGYFDRLDKRSGLTPRSGRARQIADAGRRLDAVADSVRHLPSYRVDEREGVFAVQLVRETLRELFRFEHTPTRWASGDFVPITSNVNEGATEYSYLELEHTGRAKIVADNATDIPYVEVGGRNNILPIKTLACAFTYSTQEVRTAQMQGLFDIAAEKAACAREAHDQELNDLVRAGFPMAGLYGLLTAPGIIVHSAVTGTWATADADEIVADFAAAVSSAINSSDGIESPDSVVFPVAQYTRISTLQNSVASDLTVLEFLKKAWPMIRNWDWDAGMATASSSGGPAAVIYRKDARKARVVMPMMLRPTPPQQKGLVFEVVLESRFGGVMVPKPRSITRLEGI